MSLTKKPGNETPLAPAKKPRLGNVGLPSREPGLRLRCRAGQPECGVGEKQGSNSRQGHGRKAHWTHTPKSGTKRIVSGVDEKSLVS